MSSTEKIYKYKGAEFLVEEFEEGRCGLTVTHDKATLTIRPSTEVYGTGFRIYHSGGWKGSWSTPSEALNAACNELLALAKGKTEDEWCKELKEFFDELP